MTTAQTWILVGIACLTTLLLRFSAFLLFPQGRQVPPFIDWLGSRLPRAVMAMLLVYCLKDVSFGAAVRWLPALAGVGTTAAVHLWKRKMMLSIAVGTGVYMLLIRLL